MVLCNDFVMAEHAVTGPAIGVSRCKENYPFSDLGRNIVATEALEEVLW